jgi:hypothetical protein
MAENVFRTAITDLDLDEGFCFSELAALDILHPRLRVGGRGVSLLVKQLLVRAL